MARTAGRILIAWHSGESLGLKRELESARRLAAQASFRSTFEMETMDALSGAVESLDRGSERQAGAVRLLEHLAGSAAIG